MPPGFPYSWMAPASKRALDREEQAKAKFLAAKTDFEKSVLPTLNKPGDKHTIPLLQPNCHLTSHTFGTFNRWVKEHEGWRAKRREAAPEEKEAAGAYNRGKSYFVDVIHQVPDPFKKKKKAPPTDCDDKKPAAKKKKIAPPKKPVGPFPFALLDESLQLYVMSYADGPTLGSLLRTSKSLNTLAIRDDMWAPHLQFLLKELFDDAFDACDHVTPISLRPNWRASTEFLAWYQECTASHPILVKRKNVTGSTLDVLAEYVAHPEYYLGEEDRFRWLLEDVSLREYYKQAGFYAYQGEEMHFQLMEDTNRCPNCLEKWDCVCGSDYPPGLFDNMPNILLFRGTW